MRPVVFSWRDVAFAFSLLTTQVKKRVRREICISSSEEESGSSDEELFMTATPSDVRAASNSSSSSVAAAAAASYVDDSNLDEDLKDWLNKSTPVGEKPNPDEGAAAGESEQLVVPGLKPGVHLFAHQVQGVRWMFERETDPRRGWCSSMKLDKVIVLPCNGWRRY